MKYELTQEIYFEAAHTLRRDIESESSRRIHGHTYHAEVTVQGSPDKTTGVVVDLGHFKKALERVRELLDHQFLDEVPGLGVPTLERLCEFIARSLHESLPGLSRITVARRASGDRCTLTL